MAFQPSQGSNSNDEDPLRILVATDIHLGAHENDEVRKEDSFNALEEILETASEHGADCIFLGGDLFHEAYPTRETLQRAVKTISSHVFGNGDDNTRIWLEENNRARLHGPGRANFEGNNHNVRMPIFTINGNHDDTFGDDQTSTIDVLADVGLLNYFGKQHESLASDSEKAGEVDMHPLVIRKGEAKVTLYGQGYVRDNRLKRIYNNGDAHFHHPADVLHNSLSVFLFHQNRAMHSGNAVPESSMPKWLDLVVWGHEHACMIGSDSSGVAQMRGGASGKYVCQPGSTVVTSLEEGEASDKKVFLLDVCGSTDDMANSDSDDSLPDLQPNGRDGKRKGSDDMHSAKGTKWELTPVTLQSTRPFIFKRIRIADELESERKAVDRDPIGNNKAVVRMLKAHVDRSIDEAKRRQQDKLPLIRLKVDHTGFDSINPATFGREYVGKVANPSQMLLFSKPPGPKKGAKKPAGDGDMPRQREEESNQEQIKRFMGEEMEETEMLPLTSITNALDRFVDQDERDAVGKEYTHIIRKVRQNACEMDGQDWEKNLKGAIKSLTLDERGAQANTQHGKQQKRQLESTTLEQQKSQARPQQQSHQAHQRRQKGGKDGEEVCGEAPKDGSDSDGSGRLSSGSVNVSLSQTARDACDSPTQATSRPARDQRKARGQL